ncbi:MAG: hypothetical protein ACPG19_04315 [Saprospiraceae bacterium]
MNDLGFIIVLVVVLLIVVRIAMKRVGQQKTTTCTRCDGSGFIGTDDDEFPCTRCRGSGQLFMQDYGTRRRYFDSWEK